MSNLVYHGYWFWSLRDDTIFQAKDYDCVTTLYESGKVMFQGIGADIEASYWTEQEKVLNGNYCLVAHLRLFLLNV